MYKKIIVPVIFILLSLFIFSCTKTAVGITGSPGADGTAGQSAAGTRTAITGYVRLTNQFAIPDSVYDSVTVSTFVGDSLFSVSTDKTGKYALPALPSGTYRILFTRKGYDSIARNIAHSAGNEDQFTGIMQMDGTQTTKITGQTSALFPSPFDPNFNYITISSTIDGPPITYNTQRYVNIYFSNSPNVSDHNYLFMFQTYTHNEGSNEFDEQVSFQSTAINNDNFKSGDTVYMLTSFIPPYSLMTSWFDINSYQTVSYPYTGSSFKNHFIWSN